MFGKLLLLALCSVVLPLVATVTVETTYGDIEGFTTNYPNAPPVTKFLGIPYAAPPIGQLRLKAPQPPNPWKPKVFNASQHGNICMQGPDFEVFIKYFAENYTFSENCLFLNVYTPSTSLSLPVMFYIHGGGYTIGTSITQPGDALAMLGVVVVTIQYRLGAFGFATTGDSAAPGNFGMLDQVQALKWTKENIAKFGGDPNKVTIFGLSAGATSVCLHMLSPLSEGLFHRAIAESGVDFSGFAVQPVEDGVRDTKKLAEKLGCDPSGSKAELVACIRTKEAKDVLDASRDIVRKFYKHIIWSPVVDKHFLPDSPRNLRKEGKFQKVPLIVSFNSQEGGNVVGFMVNSTFGLATSVNDGVSPALFKTYLSKLAHGRTRSKQNADLIADALDFMYTPWPNNKDPYALRSQLIDLMGDYIYVAPTHEVATIQSNYTDVFMYEFAHRSKNGSIYPLWMGVVHGDNAPYDFGIPLFMSGANSSDAIRFDATDGNVSMFIMHAYTNFAKYGHPSPTSKPLPGGVEWGPFNSTDRAYLYLDASPKMLKNFQPRRMAFWNEYRPKLAAVKFGTEDHVDSGAGLGATVGVFLQTILVAIVTLL